MSCRSSIDGNLTWTNENTHDVGLGVLRAGSKPETAHYAEHLLHNSMCALRERVLDGTDWNTSLGRPHRQGACS